MTQRAAPATKSREALARDEHGRGRLKPVPLSAPRGGPPDADSGRRQRRESEPPPSRDPFGAVLALGRRSHRIGIALGIAGALFVHGSAGAKAATALLDLHAFAGRVHARVQEQLRLRYDIQIDEPEPEPEPKPEPEPTPEVLEPQPQPLGEPEAPEPAEPEEPPPAPAEAGKVLTAEPDPNEPLDLTDQGFISGQGDRFAGGVTAASGTSKTAVRDRAARPGGVRGGRGTKPTKGTAHVRQGPDLSRPPKVLDMAILQSCPFPPESDVEQTNLAYVNVAILVGTNGKAQSVSILSESPAGQGFGREARRCALRVRYESGLDRTGNASAQSIHVRFRFTR